MKKLYEVFNEEDIAQLSIRRVPNSIFAEFEKYELEEEDLDYNYEDDDEGFDDKCVLIEEDGKQKYELSSGTYKECNDTKREILCGYEENGVCYSADKKYKILSIKEWEATCV